MGFSKQLLVSLIFCSISCGMPLATEPGSVATTIRGFIQKGPFVSGSSVKILELTESLDGSGTSFEITTQDDFGSFASDHVFKSKFVEIIANGYYFNEVAGALSDGPLTLRAVSDISDGEAVQVNVLTTLEEPRIKALMAAGASFASARTQAEKEVLAAFNIDSSALGTFDRMDISKSGDSNAVLLAVSAALQGSNTVAELSELISKIALDVGDDGSLNGTGASADLAAKIVAGETGLDLANVRENLENRYNSLGLSVEVPAFESFIDSDGDGFLNKFDFVVAFNAVTGAELGSTNTSNGFQVVLPPSIPSATASTTAGTLTVNGTEVASPSPVRSGDTVAVRLVASSALDSTVSATVVVSDGTGFSNTGDFVVTTRGIDVSRSSEIASFTATPAAVPSGQSQAITWTWTYKYSPNPAPRCSIDSGVGTMTSGASTLMTLSEPTTFTLTCENAEGTYTATTLVHIGQATLLAANTSHMGSFIVDSSFAYYVQSVPGLGHSLVKVRLDGNGTPETIVPEGKAIAAFDVDSEGIYWSSVDDSTYPQASEIRKVGHSGGAVQVLYTPVAGYTINTMVVDGGFICGFNTGGSGFTMTPTAGGGTVSFVQDVFSESMTSDGLNLYLTSGAAAGAVSVYSKPLDNTTAMAPLASRRSLDEAVDQIVVSAGNLYWTTFKNEILQVPTTGGTPTAFVTASGVIVALAADGKDMYWVESSSGKALLKRASLAGGASSIVASREFLPQFLKVDASSLYWVEWVPYGSQLIKMPK